jgi:RHS repeat-associated protein
MATTLGQLNPLRYRGYVYDTETGLYYLQSRYYNPEIGRFINADAFAATGQGILGNNMFAYCGNNPVSREDDGGAFWNTIIGTVAGAIVGGATAAIMGTDISAGIVSGALSGAISGAAVDIAIATGGVGLVALAGVAAASGAGGAAGSYVNQRMNGVEHKDVDWGTVIIDGAWGAVGGAVSFGMADVGGITCKTLAANLALKGKDLVVQAGSDFATAAVISSGIWLNGSKMNMLYKRLG